jgi:Ran GTPase-activating protein (RanGAP) involved in mRNA processing and transport
LCSYLSSRTCILEVLDLSWNSIGERGAIEFSNALRTNKSLKKLNLSANGLNDLGGQRMADSIPDHTTIEEINLSQNGLRDGTCFVLSQVNWL